MLADMRWVDRNLIYRVADDTQASLLQHIVDSWPHRKVATTYVQMLPEMLADNPNMLDYAEQEVRLKLDDHTRGYMVISSSFSWWRMPGMYGAAPAVDEDRLLPVEGDVTAEARMIARVHYAATLVLKGQALCLPAGPDLLPASVRPQMSARGVARTGPDAVTPDTSQPYPLDDLLHEIEGLTH